jgi:hypothetical protein
MIVNNLASLSHLVLQLIYQLQQTQTTFTAQSQRSAHHTVPFPPKNTVNWGTVWYRCTKFGRNRMPPSSE